MLELTAFAANVVTVAIGLYGLFRFSRRLLRIRAAAERSVRDAGGAHR